jgi:hypothetical protein
LAARKAPDSRPPTRRGRHPVELGPQQGRPAGAQQRPEALRGGRPTPAPGGRRAAARRRLAAAAPSRALWCYAQARAPPTLTPPRCAACTRPNPAARSRRRRSCQTASPRPPRARRTRSRCRVRGGRLGRAGDGGPRCQQPHDCPSWRRHPRPLIPPSPNSPPSGRRRVGGGLQQRRAAGAGGGVWRAQPRVPPGPRPER